MAVDVKKFVVWNNKGGTGKTFTTYVLATEFAIANPDFTVVAVDMCPQANLSELMLGGNGCGYDRLVKATADGKGIAQYIKHRFAKSPFDITGNENGFFLDDVHRTNESMPVNLCLLPSDSSLDLCNELVDYIANAATSMNARDPWTISRSMLADLLSAKSKRHDTKMAVFIDCNPSFASYTQLAILAANYLIMPCIADASSVRGIHNVLESVYGYKDSDTQKLLKGFDTKVQDRLMPLPQILFGVLNKSHTHAKRAPNAFTISEERIQRVFDPYVNSLPDVFYSKKPKIHNIKDGNTLVPVMFHEAVPLSGLESREYTLYCDEEKLVQVDKDQLDCLKKQVNEMVVQCRQCFD